MILYAIGDIHGCNDQLKQLLAIITTDMQNYPGEQFELVFIGDYVDRGPDSFGVIDTILDVSQTGPFSKVVRLRGNHEGMMLGAIDGDRGSYSDWISNGGISTLASYGLAPTGGNELHQLPRDHIDFIRTTQLYYQCDHVVCVHAGIDPTLALVDQTEQIMLWSRKFNTYDRLYPLGFYVVHGHTPSRFGAHRLTAQVNIDTGAFMGEPLTACVINTKGPFGNCRILHT